MRKRKVKKKPTHQTLYAYISPETTKFLKAIQARQVGRVSKSTLVEKIFHGLRKKPSVLKSLGV